MGKRAVLQTSIGPEHPMLDLVKAVDEAADVVAVDAPEAGDLRGQVVLMVEEQEKSS